jgi:hypothetical protein
VLRAAGGAQKVRLQAHDCTHPPPHGSDGAAMRSMKVKSLPPILALHLKRFKFNESLQRFKKLS